MPCLYKFFEKWKSYSILVVKSVAGDWVSSTLLNSDYYVIFSGLIAQEINIEPLCSGLFFCFTRPGELLITFQANRICILLQLYLIPFKPLDTGASKTQIRSEFSQRLLCTCIHLFNPSLQLCTTSILVFGVCQCVLFFRPLITNYA